MMLEAKLVAMNKPADPKQVRAQPAP